MKQPSNELTDNTPQKTYHYRVSESYDEEGRPVTLTNELMGARWVLIGSTNVGWTFVEVSEGVYSRVYARFESSTTVGAEEGEDQDDVG
jgi:hypothetical protein